MLKNIAHIMFYTSNKARLVEFYKDKLGFELNNPKDADIYMMHLPNGGPTIGFIEHKDLKEGNRALELTFLVDSIREVVPKLKEKGVIFANENNIVAEGMYVANFNDPDGNHLALLSFKP